MIVYRTSSFSDRYKDDEYLHRFLDDYDMKHLKKVHKNGDHDHIDKYIGRSVDSCRDKDQVLSRVGESLGTYAGAGLLGYGVGRACGLDPFTSAHLGNATGLATSLGSIFTRRKREKDRLKRIVEDRLNEPEPKRSKSRRTR